MNKVSLSFLFLLCSIFGLQAQNILYVDLNATGNNDGTSWTDAYTDFQVALSVVTNSDSIWVAQGTYYGNFSRNSGNYAVLGGFDGTETMESQRDWEANPTILDGQGAGRVFSKSGAGTSIYFDGFTIQNGIKSNYGSGFYLNTESAILKNMLFQNNGLIDENGGAITFRAQDKAYLENVSFINNTGDKGAAIWTFALDTIEMVRCSVTDNISDRHAIRTDFAILIMDSCVVENNTSTSSTIYLWNGACYLSNCLFSGNVGTDGSAFNASGAWEAEIDNCVFVNNYSNWGRGTLRWRTDRGFVSNCSFYDNYTTGGVLSVYPPDYYLDIYNCVFDQNAGAGTEYDIEFESPGSSYNQFITIGNSLMQVGIDANVGSFTDTNNLVIGLDPQFLDTTDLDGPDNTWFTNDDGLILLSTSPAVLAGDTVNAPAGDVTGLARPFPPSIGAYEYLCLQQPEPSNPTVACKDTTLYLDSLGLASMNSADVLLTSFDNCGVASKIASDTTFDCSELGVNTVTLTVTDFSGYTNSCAAMVTVIDTLEIEPICQNIAVYLDNSGLASIAHDDIDNGSWDNCALNFSTSKTTFDCNDLGSNNVTLTLTDIAGNTATCSSVVDIIDSIQPIATTQNMDIYLDANGEATITPLDVDNGSSDNCGIDTSYLSQNQFDCSHIGNNTVLFTIADTSGNDAGSTFNVSVYDTTTPTIVTQNTTVYLDGNGLVQIGFQDLDLGSFDNCGIASSVLSETIFNCNDLGPNTISITLTDVNGNVSTQDIVLTVADAIAPTVNCQNLTRALGANGSVVVSASELSVFTDDNCGSSIALSQSVFDCNDLGTNTVTLTATDPSGNSSTCDATITIIDDLPPTPIVSSLSDIETTCEVSTLSNPSAVDNCSGVTISNNATLPITSDATILWTYTDASGNTTMQTQDVVISGVEATVLQTNDLTLEAINNNAENYQWINCSDNQPVSGANYYYFSPVQNGIYAVIITDDGCTDTSACYTIDQVGIEDLSASDILLVPNPSIPGLVRVTSDAPLTGIHVFDALGQSVQVHIDLNQKTINASQLSPGTYLVAIETELDTTTQRLVIIE
ncbi:MAG: hypothetical protein Crog4KO_07990 [Crocinitomicaceae bacterium]